MLSPFTLWATLTYDPILPNDAVTFSPNFLNARTYLALNFDTIAEKDYDLKANSWSIYFIGLVRRGAAKAVRGTAYAAFLEKWLTLKLYKAPTFDEMSGLATTFPDPIIADPGANTA